jgi:predicted flap endonuclease-1-like 5' DNA nuclease
MNTERFFEGPGSSSMTTYVWEISVILLGAFILGYLLRYLLNSKLTSKIALLETELEQIRSTEPIVHTSAGVDSATFELKIKEQRIEIESLNNKLTDSYAKQEMVKNELSSLKLKLVETDNNSIVLRESGVVADTDALNLQIKEQRQEIDNLNEKLSVCYAKKIKVESELDSLQRKDNSAIEEVATIVSKPSVSIESGVIVDEAIHKPEVKTTDEVRQKDNLKKIEGIGPKIEQLLNNDGIYTYKDLIAASVARIRGVLAAAGPNYAVHDPSTWGEQAYLAHAELWDALAELQDELKGGKRK